MFRTKMLGYLKNKTDSVSKNYTAALKNTDPEGLHDLRVDIKRLRAYFGLVDSINRDFDMKGEFKYFRNIARNTGSLRDAQVQLKLLAHLVGTTGFEVSGFAGYLKNYETKARERFEKFSKKKPLKNSRECRKSISRSLKAVSPVRADTRVQGYFYNLRNNLILLNEDKNLHEATLHEVRKLSKKTHYVLEIIQPCFDIFKDSKPFIKNLSQVHKILGEWHDYDVCLGHLKIFQKKNPEAFAASQLPDLLKHVKNTKRGLVKDIHREFDKFSKAAALYEHRK